MLKKKLIKKGLGGALLLTIVIINTAGIPHFSTHTKETLYDSTLQRISFDPLLLTVDGISETEAVTMPSIQLNKNAEQYVEDYVAKYSRVLQKIKERSPSYFTIMDSVFTRNGLPVELKYVAIVESQLKPGIVSPAGAAGAWQLMPVTARTFSLKVTPGHDERMHFYKSTVAAAKYLRYLHNKFNDWLLVIAAYNGGPGSVYKAIKKSGSRNFWKLQDYLPAESRIHVKKFISTHYYFEGKGSITTITKDEATAYSKMMVEFVEKQNTLREEKQADDKEQKIAKISPNAETILNDDEE